MDDFLKEFFPWVYERKQHVQENNYCKYHDGFLHLFTSSLYIAALIASFLASSVCSSLLHLLAVSPSPCSSLVASSSASPTRPSLSSSPSSLRPGRGVPSTSASNSSSRAEDPAARSLRSDVHHPGI
ncbi:hypothetical protein SAY87_018962 [Trapa incisa]|uniref:Uncharacterized protein n=1 Tax=Trapa incisa TaxID=236973 RepID=A0AAN7K0T8_9MYRT|nr:hypothetical protein SAY87_018962 [Trapa incisa]